MRNHTSVPSNQSSYKVEEECYFSELCYYKVKKKMPFTDEDKIAIRHYILGKGYGVKRLFNESSNKNWSTGGLRHF